MTATRTVLSSVAAAVVLGATSPAGALPILDPEDATELAQALAEAAEDQDICYGWDVLVENQGSGTGGRDTGSSLGVGARADGPDCPRSVTLQATVVYTSESSEAEDAAAVLVQSDPPGMVTPADLGRVGFSAQDLLGDDDDTALANAVLALPALAAEAGFAPAVALEPNKTALPAGDRATGTPGSDWLRRNGGALGAAAMVALAGAGWGAWIIVTEHPFRRGPRRRSLHLMPRR